MRETVGNVTVRAEIHDTDPDTVKSLGDVSTKFDHLRGEMKEHLYAVFLNAANEELAEKLIGLGTAAEINVDVADIVRTAVLTNARAVILVHNHPSGDASPSADDLEATRSIRDALKLLDISLLDHVIIGSSGTHTMKGNDDIGFTG